MTKAEIVTEIAKKTGIEKKDVLNTIEAFMEVVKESLTKEENVYLRGFGSFIVKKRAQKTARNISKTISSVRLSWQNHWSFQTYASSDFESFVSSA